MSTNPSNIWGLAIPNRQMRRFGGIRRLSQQVLISNSDVSGQQLLFLGERTGEPTLHPFSSKVPPLGAVMSEECAADCSFTSCVMRNGVNQTDPSFIPCVLPPNLPSGEKAKCCRELGRLPESKMEVIEETQEKELQRRLHKVAISPLNQFYLPDYCEVYTVAYNSPERAEQMTERFAKVGLPLNVHTGVQMDDQRLAFAGEDISAKRLASVFYGHLDNIAKFYETGKPFGLFCEDDVHIHKDLGKELPIIMGEFNAMKLDILLLGYMTTKTIEWWQHNYPLVYDGDHVPYRYHRYPQDQWGIHLFMISRSYAKTLLEVYGPDYAARAHVDHTITCYNPDWTLSKHTQQRALRYPMMAVEDGKGDYDHLGQGEFHRESHRKNYREGEFY